MNRSGASLETNPVDVHRATDAVLAGIDHVARSCPNVTFVATTNYRPGVDGAFLSRADLIEAFGLPGPEAIALILSDAFAELAPGSTQAPDDLVPLAAACAKAGLDARQVRKLVLRAIYGRRSLAIDPTAVTTADVLAALGREPFPRAR